MKITCALCGAKNEIIDNTLLAKKLTNHPIKVYICKECHQRIKIKCLNKLNSKQND